MNHKFATYDDISEVIKQQVDNFEFKIPCIIDKHEASISETESEIISFDQSVNDYIIEQLDDSETNNWIKDLTEFGMAASYITSTPRGISIQSINPMAMHTVMPSVIGGLNHNIIIADDIRMKEPELIQFEEECLFKEKISIDDINKFSKYYVDNFLGKDVKIFKKYKVSKDTPQIIDAIIFQEEKQPKINHPRGWYRKFEKKRF